MDGFLDSRLRGNDSFGGPPAKEPDKKVKRKAVDPVILKAMRRMKEEE